MSKKPSREEDEFCLLAEESVKRSVLFAAARYVDVLQGLRRAGGGREQLLAAGFFGDICGRLLASAVISARASGADEARIEELAKKFDCEMNRAYDECTSQPLDQAMAFFTHMPPPESK